MCVCVHMTTMAGTNNVFALGAEAAFYWCQNDGAAIIDELMTKLGAG